MQTSRITKYIVIVFLCLIGLYYTFFAVISNLDLSTDRYVLYMDEHLSFDGVRAILHPPSFKKFFSAVLDGGDHRYGRILWNVSALFSFLPEILFGSQGQIIATRMVHFTALLAAYLILIFTLITYWPLRALGFLSLLSIITTFYYATMPKPEPLQLLFLALFLWQAKRHRFAFGKHWIFLGLAFGAKISVFLLIFFFAMLAFLRRFAKGFEKENNNDRPVVALRFFLLGFLIAEPVFLLTFRKFDLRYFHNYLQWTFLNTGHGSDDLSVTWLSWLKHLFGSYTNIPLVLLIPTTLCVCILIFIHLKSFIRQLKSDGAIDILFEKYSALIFLTASFILIVPNMFLIKRISTYYLHNGMAIFLIGILGLIELSVASKEKEFNRFLLSKYIAFLLTGLLAIESLFFLMPSQTKVYMQLSKRTQEENFKKQLKEYNYITSLLTKISDKIGRKVMVFFDSNLFLPYSNDKYELELYWGYFVFWSKGKDAVIFYTENIGTEPLPKTSAMHDASVEAINLLKEYVVSSAKEGCKTSPCYYAYRSKMDNISIYINTALYESLKDLQKEEE